MTDLIALAGRVEEATGPDRRLLINAYEAIHGTTSIDYARWGRFEALVNVGAYLDAAMTLIPEGCAPMQDWLHYTNDSAGVIAYEYDVQRTTDGYSLGHGEARTPALALTAACLRARAVQGETK